MLLRIPGGWGAAPVFFHSQKTFWGIAKNLTLSLTKDIPPDILKSMYVPTFSYTPERNVCLCLPLHS